MKRTKKSSKVTAGIKPARVAAKAKKPATSKVKVTKATKATKASTGKSSPTAVTAKAIAVPTKPVHEWAEAIKKAALQNKQGHNAWPGAGSPSWKGKQRPE